MQANCTGHMTVSSAVIFSTRQSAAGQPPEQYIYFPNSQHETIGAMPCQAPGSEFGAITAATVSTLQCPII